MKLPRFPIRKSLIPYDDLGIQEVSGDNQVLGDDIGITLAPAIGLGPTGARVLQTNDNGDLLTDDVINNPLMGDLIYHNIVDTITVTDTITTIPIDLSKYRYGLLIFNAVSFGNPDNSASVSIYFMSTKGSRIDLFTRSLRPNSLFATALFTSNFYNLSMPSKINADIVVAGTTPSADVYIDLLAV